jgi:alpha-L-arabinofuranosidase
MRFLVSTLTLLTGFVAHAAVDIAVDCAKPAAPLSPHFYGLFFEDINWGADGGLYAELVQNRSFEYFQAPRQKANMNPLTAWEKVERGGAKCEIAVESAEPLNANNTKYLTVTISNAGSAAGVSNSGFDGIRLDSGARYDISLYARTKAWSGDAAVTATLELPDGTACGSVTFDGIGSTWKKFSGVITATRTTDDARLVVTTKGRGTLALDMVSLFPQDTWMGRKNGLRKDLVQALKDLNPKFLRFPGGCITHGEGLANAYQWKDTLGDVAERKPNWNTWGYHQTYGLGYYEYFQLCEDLGMTPLPVMTVGVSCGFRRPFENVPMDHLQSHIDDALDLIEFANGPANSKWGAVRAKMGHPAPFGLEFICLGNEEHDTPAVRERFPLFVEAIRKAHPEIKIIGTSGLGPQIPLYDLMTKLKIYASDEHYYENPEWFIENQTRFDTFPRGGPKVFIGEYASKSSKLFSALAEAAYLTGAERNGDLVDMTCYAPLFGRFGHTQWNPNLIYFDKRHVVRTANYYVQQLFATNKGDVNLAHTVAEAVATKSPTISGQLGVGSWNSAIEFADVRVNGKPVDLGKWTATGGRFTVENGRGVQSDATATPAMMTSTELYDGDTVTYTLRARKTGGTEGFLIRFGAKDGQGGYWWNVGGWNNKRHGLQRFDGTAKATVVDAPGSIPDNAWHDLKIQLSPGRIQCHLDGKLVHDYVIKPAKLSVGSALDKAAGEVIVKLVNPTRDPIDARIMLKNAASVAPKARLITLSGAAGAVNTIEQPDMVKPVTSEVAASAAFSHTVPAMAVQFLRIKVR